MLLQKTFKQTPVLGTAVRFTSEAAEAITTHDSAEFKFQRKFDKQLKKLSKLTIELQFVHT